MIEFTFCFVRDIHTTSTCDFLQERFLKNYFFGINEEDNLTKNPKKYHHRDRQNVHSLNTRIAAKNYM